jgi:hypothetical protein
VEDVEGAGTQKLDLESFAFASSSYLIPESELSYSLKIN